MVKNSPILIKTANADKPTPAQKKFNTIMKRINKQKQALEAWKELLPRYRQEYQAMMSPLEQTFTQGQEQIVLALDNAYKNEKLTDNQKDKVCDLIGRICGHLIEVYQCEDLKPLYNFYANTDYDQEEEEAKAEYFSNLKAAMKQDFGVEMEDAEFTPEGMAGIRERLFEKLEQEQAAEEARRAKRKKSAKQLAKEEREQKESEELGKSIQTIYRQLVTVLHPDREPDEQERVRKTELMQQVTVAYENKDLLKLLELQLALEQIDQAHLSNLAEERLKYFNRILKDQLDELEQEVFHYEQQAAQLVNLGIPMGITPQQVPMLIKQEVASFKRQVDQLQLDVQAMQELRSLKAWLNNYKIPQPVQYFTFEL